LAQTDETGAGGTTARLDVRLRPATAADRELLFGIYASTRAEELAVVDWPAAMVEAFLRQQFEAQDVYYRATFSEASFDLIVVDGRPAGRLYLYPNGTETTIIDIALLPDFRGRGVGTRLVADVLADAAVRGSCVTIHVERFNRALAWYRRLGFVAVDDLGVYLLLRWQPEPTNP
jgi:ribosomal protein S18 acetylase RimI-like enzyme